MGKNYELIEHTADIGIKVRGSDLVELFKTNGKSIGLQLEQCKSINDVWVNDSNVSSTRHIENCKKVIATTDTSLKIKHQHSPYLRDWNLPQPSQQFIKEYIESYNKGEVITYVLVEYELKMIHNGRINSNTKIWEEVKVNPKDNTITIKPIKDSWSRDEVKDILSKFCFYLTDNMELKDALWIEENL